MIFEGLSFREKIKNIGQMFFKIGVLKNFAIFTGKHPCWSLFLIKLKPNIGHMFLKTRVLKKFAIFTGKHLCWRLKACNFIKKRLQHRCFFLNVAKSLRTAFIEHF